ncbi:tRNA dihydrouridine(20/20a) synthase DusA [Halofilum ochraceum]|uniref:tRNA dihydrouridine(20/20a) synthase DusA n=1 Tax=Halofilum ochraceum TaxID=1611323 RepID=UPI000946BD65|nr:tRNA dihydrouridine(20/20a) synthase DusA [Halofilum ochraceum]
MTLDRTLSIAPMMDCTDRHDRYLLRLISRRVLLYTEMITANALIHGDPARLLAYDPFEHPVALQIGGSEPERMAAAARMAEDFGYDEVNINVGCPSDRVKNGAFGACLMAEPDTVAECVRAMRATVSIPVTVKSRIGIDDQDSYEHLNRFTAAVAEAGTEALIVHARKAWLQGLSPKENREIPPLDYERVYRLKRDWSALPIVINGGIRTLDEAAGHLPAVDGCMLGRGPYGSPWSLAGADSRFWGDPDPLDSPHEAVAAYMPYVHARLAEGVPIHHMTRHMSGLFQGQPGARAWRRTLAEGAAAGGGAEIIEQALARLPEPEAERAAV